MYPFNAYAIKRFNNKKIIHRKAALMVKCQLAKKQSGAGTAYLLRALISITCRLTGFSKLRAF